MRNVAEAEKNGGRLLLRTADDFRDDVKKYEYKIEEYRRSEQQRITEERRKDLLEK